LETISTSALCSNCLFCLLPFSLLTHGLLLLLCSWPVGLYAHTLLSIIIISTPCRSGCLVVPSWIADFVFHSLKLRTEDTHIGTRISQFLFTAHSSLFIIISSFRLYHQRPLQTFLYFKSNHTDQQLHLRHHHHHSPTNGPQSTADEGDDDDEGVILESIPT